MAAWTPSDMEHTSLHGFCQNAMAFQVLSWILYTFIARLGVKFFAGHGVKMPVKVPVQADAVYSKSESLECGGDSSCAGAVTDYKLAYY